jgi:hypothetical protein
VHRNLEGVKLGDMASSVLRKGGRLSFGDVEVLVHREWKARCEGVWKLSAWQFGRLSVWGCGRLSA